MVRVLGWGLRLWALVQVAVAALWIVGPYGAGFFSGGHLPHGVYVVLSQTLLAGLFTGPTLGARLTEPGVTDKLLALSTDLTGYHGEEVRGAFGDINLGWSVQFVSLTTAQGLAWVALHVLPLLTMAVLWWALAHVVTQSRRETVFTPANARRLAWAGWAVLAGAPLLSVITWRFQHWVADSSQIARRIEVPAYSWSHLPWTAIAAGFALVVLGQVWRRGSRIENELGGLV
jgi:Protein of unknown function (DUF2975)